MERENDQLIQEFQQKLSCYNRLTLHLKESIRYLLDDNDIQYLDVYHRVKDIDSFLEKVLRKNYDNPFDSIEDICGVRIVCYYPSDIQRIKNIIYDEFEINNSEDKSDLLEIDKFGYRSYHFIIKLKKEWLKIPNFRGLDNLKVELQVRTILMHAWADISHKLAYKKKEHIPEIFQRKLFQLSALFEIADDRFESLRNERKKYIETLFSEKGEFNIYQELNLDSLSTFLDFYFQDREHDDKSNASLLDELIFYNISLYEMFSAYVRVKEKLPELEKEAFGKRRGKWAQTGAMRHILDLTNDRYWLDRKKMFESIAFNNNKITEKQRRRLIEEINT